MDDTTFNLPVLVAIVAATLVVYMFATKDNEYVFLKDREKPWQSKRQSINYYAWRGPMFTEDFKNIDESKVQQCHIKAMNQCRVRTQTAEQGWRNEYWNSPHLEHGPERSKVGGPNNFAQITNNNLDAPNNLPSAQMRSVMGDWFNDADKVSPYCYALTYKQCMKS